LSQHAEDTAPKPEVPSPLLDQLELEFADERAIFRDEAAEREREEERDHFDLLHDYEKPDSGFAYDYVQHTAPKVATGATLSAPATSKGYKYKRASEVKEEQVPWLWTNRIPFGCLTILDGDPGVGKTTIVLDLMSRLSSARAMPFETVPHPEMNSLVVSVEDSIAYTIVPRLRAAGADLDRVNVLIDFPIFPSGLERLRSTVKETRSRLVMVDPGLAMFDAEINPNSDAETRKVVGGLAALAADTESAVVFVRHLNKNLTNPRAMYRGGGSIAISATARSGLVAAYSRKQEANTLASYKSSLSLIPPTLTYRIVGDPADPKRVSRIEWIEEVAITADEVLDIGPVIPGRGGDVKRDKAAGNLKEMLLRAVELVGDRGASAGELQKVVKKRKDAVQEALDELVRQARLKYEEQVTGKAGRPKGVYKPGEGVQNPLDDSPPVGPQEDFGD
jgi:hypothetical protein